MLVLFVEAFGGSRLAAVARILGVFAFAIVAALGGLAWSVVDGRFGDLAAFSALGMAVVGAALAGSALLMPRRRDPDDDPRE